MVMSDKVNFCSWIFQAPLWVRVLFVVLGLGFGSNSGVRAEDMRSHLSNFAGLFRDHAILDDGSVAISYRALFPTNETISGSEDFSHFIEVGVETSIWNPQSCRRGFHSFRGECLSDEDTVEFDSRSYWCPSGSHAIIPEPGTERYRSLTRNPERSLVVADLRCVRDSAPRSAEGERLLNRVSVLPIEMRIRIPLNGDPDLQIQRLRVGALRAIEAQTGITLQFISFVLERLNAPSVGQLIGGEVVSVDLNEARIPLRSRGGFEMIFRGSIRLQVAQLINSPYYAAQESPMGAGGIISASAGFRIADRLIIEGFGGSGAVAIGRRNNMINPFYGASIGAQVLPWLNIGASYRGDVYFLNQHAEPSIETGTHSLIFNVQLDW